MKKQFLVLILLTIVGLGFQVVAQPGAPGGPVDPSQMTDEAILGTMDFHRFSGYFNPELPGTTFTSEILAERPDGSKQAVVQVSFLFSQEGGFTARIDYLTPEELAGDVFLITNEEVFFWNPDLISPIKVNGQFEVFGDATVAEVVGIFFSGDYIISDRAELTLDDGTPALKYDLVATRESVAFQKAGVVADALTLRPITLELFDESGDLLHLNSFESYSATADGRPFFNAQLLDNRVVPVNQTLLKITNIESKVLPDELFDVNQLGA